MMPKGHIICGIVLGVFLWLLGIEIIPILLIISASILVDIDHVINYIAKFNRYNILEMNKYFRRDVCLRNSNEPLPIFIFHNYETLIILAILSIFSPSMIYLFIGVVFHMILDWLVMPTDKYPAIIKISLIMVLIENSRRKGSNPKW